MGSVNDNKQLATAMVSLATALTSGLGLSVATLGTALASYISSDTGATKQTSAFVTAIASGVQSAQPSSSIHTYFGDSNIDARCLVNGLAILATCLTSVSSATRAAVQTSISNQITADTGLSTAQVAILTSLSSAIGQTVSPTLSINSLLGST